MQDRFKFRTWIPDLKYFVYWGWVKEGEYKNLCACRDNSKDELLEKYTQQCTGLKDKNGKLIYEGDIIKTTCGDSWELMVAEYLENMASFIYRRLDNTYYPLPILGERNFEEVIGNIYETPELLNEVIDDR